MQQISFSLQAFEGPLDLLLYLVQKNKVNIYDIPIADITDQYMEYIGNIRLANLELSSEFLVMAAQLLYIKSRLLLPKPKEDAEVEALKMDLSERLAEYKLYKDVSCLMDDLQLEGAYCFYKERESLALASPLPPLRVSVEELTAAFMRVLDRGERLAPPQADSFRGVVGREKTSVIGQARRIVDFLGKNGRARFDELFTGTRSQKVASFLAVLELIKGNRMNVCMDEDELYCVLICANDDILENEFFSEGGDYSLLTGDE